MKETIGILTSKSSPVIVEFGVQPELLDSHRYLWPIFVANLYGLREPWQEFSTRCSIPPEQVQEILDETSARWPVSSAQVDSTQWT